MTANRHSFWSAAKVVLTAVGLLLVLATVYATLSRQVGENAIRIDGTAERMQEIREENSKLRGHQRETQDKTLKALRDLKDDMTNIRVDQAEIKSDIRHLRERLPR